MGIYDREYMADSRKRRGFKSWSMVTWLLALNTLLYLVQHLIFDNRIKDAVNLSGETLFRGEFWRLLTFQFCHADIAHFFGNMLFLFFLGRMFEQVLGSKRVLPVYLLGGFLGGLVHVFWGFVFPDATVIGASASVTALATALILTIPEQRISLLFLPFQFRIKYFGWFLLIGNILGLFMTLRSTSGVSYISHLGGMAAGWMFVAFLLPMIRKRENRNPAGMNRKKRSKVAEVAEIQIKKKRQKETIYLNKKVDRILEKISEEGMQSLTEEEKNVLERSSEKLSKKLGQNEEGL